MKKIALTIALALAASGLTFAAAGQNKPATTTTANKAKKHKKTKKAAEDYRGEKVTAVNEPKAPSPTRAGGAFWLFGTGWPKSTTPGALRPRSCSTGCYFLWFRSGESGA